MKKKLICFALLVSFSSQLFLAAQSRQDSVLSSMQRINLIVEELNQIQTEKENYLRELESLNEENRKEIEERKLELQERLNELEQRRQELSNLKMQLELFGDLIDEQASYIKKLSMKSKVWQVISGILGVGLMAAIIWGASK